MDEERIPLPGEIAAGDTVIDVEGVQIGKVRAIYPHYLAVETTGPRLGAVRVPRRAVGGVEGGQITLTVARDALDPMTPSALAAFGLPEHGEQPG
jgi:hypothetical protein